MTVPQLGRAAVAGAVAAAALAGLVWTAMPTSAAPPAIGLSSWLEGPVFTAGLSTPSAVGSAPTSIAAGDLDGDGRIDLATADAGDHTVSLLFRAADGSYAKRVLPGLGNHATAIKIGDFLGTGQGADFAVTNGDSDTLTVFRRDAGNAAGYSAVTLPTGETPNALAAGDLNGDGRTDLALTNRTSSTLMLFVKDATGDGFTVTTLPTAGVPHGPDGPIALAIGDLSGNGPHDVAVADGNAETVTLYLRSPSTGAYTTKTVPAGGDTTTAIALGDLGGEGPGSDMVVKNVHNNTVTLLLRDPGADSGYSPTVVDTGANNSSGSKGIAIGDVDGACLPASASYGGFGLPRPGLTQAQIEHCLPGVAIPNRSEQSVIVLTKDATGPGWSRTTIPLGASPVGLVLGDLTGSGKLDLATVNDLSSDVTLLTNTTARVRFAE